MWILIIFFSTMWEGGVDVEHIRFKTQQACEAAAARITQLSKNDAKHRKGESYHYVLDGLATAICVSEGKSTRRITNEFK